jgi:hypothetical protein
MANQMTNGMTVRPPKWGRWSGLLVVLALALSSLGAGGCATSQRDGLDAAQLPEAVRPDYALFARRCSKCHSLARPLGSGITDDAVWIAYVDKMRRQPGSGISPQDAGPILRFLHYYSSEQRRIKRERDEASGGPANPALAASKPPVSLAPSTRSDGNRETVPVPSRDGLHSASLAPATR